MPTAISTTFGLVHLRIGFPPNVTSVGSFRPMALDPPTRRSSGTTILRDSARQASDNKSKAVHETATTLIPVRRRWGARWQGRRRGLRDLAYVDVAPR